MSWPFVDDALSTLVDVGRLFGTIVGTVALVAVVVIFAGKVLDSRAMDAARTAATDARKRAQIAAGPPGTPPGVPGPRTEGPEAVSVDAGGPHGPAESEFTTPETPNPVVSAPGPLEIALRSPVPDDAAELDGDPDPDGPFGVAVPVA